MTRRASAVAAIAATILAATGCKPRETQVNGDVFIATKGGQNFKLGLVEVRFIPEAAVGPAIAKKVEETVPALAKLRADVESKQEMEPHLRAMLGVSEHLVEVSRGTMEMSAELGRSAYREAKASHQDALASYKRELEKHIEYVKTITAGMEAISDYESGCVFARDLPPPVASAKTDADGKFTVTLRAGRYATVAVAQREVGGETENYCWLVWLTAGRDPQTRIMLTNDNVAPTMCSECIVPMTKLAKGAVQAQEPAKQ